MENFMPFIIALVCATAVFYFFLWMIQPKELTKSTRLFIALFAMFAYGLQYYLADAISPKIVCPQQDCPQQECPKVECPQTFEKEYNDLKFKRDKFLNEHKKERKHFR